MKSFLYFYCLGRREQCWVVPLVDFPRLLLRLLLLTRKMVERRTIGRGVGRRGDVHCRRRYGGDSWLNGYIMLGGDGDISVVVNDRTVLSIVSSVFLVA